MPRPNPYQPSLFQEPPKENQTATATLRERSRHLQAIALLSTVTGMTHAEVDKLLIKAGGLDELARLPDYALMALPHVGERRAKQIRALTEWALLLGQADPAEQVQIRSAKDAADLLMLEMSLLEQEELRVIGLDTKNKIKFVETIYKGSMNSAMVRIAEVLRRPITSQCASIILFHNHPSGDPTPSPEDVRITELVCESGRLFDIDVLDHIVIGRNRYVSLKERGLGFG
jgi:DNA repair protein RadC